MEARRLVILDEWSGKYMINNEYYTPLDYALTKKFEELRYVPVPSILFYDIEEFSEIAYSIGTDWNGKNRIIPNLLEVDGKWDAMRQPRLFEDDTIIRRVK